MKQWRIDFSSRFLKEFKKIPRLEQRRIEKFLTERVLPNPLNLAKLLTGNYSGYWRYRIGNYRIIAEIKEEVLLVIALEIGHRKEIYRRKYL